MTGTLAGLMVALLLTLGAATAHAGAPSEALKTGVDKALKVLEDPALKGEVHASERRKQLREIADTLFDFDEMSRRTLATHWQKRTADERQKFTTLFADLLENTYFAQVDTYSGGGNVRYGAESIKTDQATVRTAIVTAKGTEIPAEYRMHQKGGRWMVYDVSIEGVSLVNNYRAQFSRVLASSSYQELVHRMKDKTPGL